jgi:chromate transporter
MNHERSQADESHPAPTWREAMRFWIKLGCISFGGPAGQIAIMHKELVQQKRWISESQFTHALNFCMILPGPEAQQLATYLGWRMHGLKGGIFAGVWFLLPSAVLLLGLSWLAMIGTQWSWLQAIFFGLQAAVVALIAEALLRMGKKILHQHALWLVAVVSLLLSYAGQVSFVLIVAAAAVFGWLRSRSLNHRAQPTQASLIRQGAWPRLGRIALVGLLLWLMPLLAIGSMLGKDCLMIQMAIFFTKAAWVTFGGAYAVLPYVAQQAVEHYGWLSHAQMMSGLALAETTPGPLIMVLQFVGFVAGWQNPAPLSALAAGTLGAAVTTWYTFLPSFLMIFATAPYLESWTSQPRLRATMQAISAAVIGVMAQLFLVLLQHSWLPQPSAISWPAVSISLIALLLLKKTRLGAVSVIVLSALAGFVFG